MRASGAGKPESSIRMATAIQFAAKYINVAVHLVVTMVLARLLTPGEYGVMAVIAVFLGLFAVLSNFGIGAAVVQYRHLEQDEIESLFTFTIVLGIVLALVFCALSLPVSWWFGSGEYVPLMCFASVTVVFQAANMVPNGLMLRDRLFRAIGVRLVVTSVVAGALAVAMAAGGFGVYALVANTAVQSALVLAWNVYRSGIRRLGRRCASALRKVGRFSSFQFGAQLVQYLSRNLDTLLISAVFGSAVVGVYDKAYKLARYPVEIVPSTLNPVLKSFFSAMDGDLDALFDLYFKIQKALSIIGVFISIFCFFAANELVAVLFGEQWSDSVPLLKLLSVSIVFQMLNFSVGSVLEGAKRTDYLLAVICIAAGVLLALLTVGLMTGNVAIVAGLVSLGLILYTVPVLFFVVRKTFGKSVKSYVAHFLPEFACGVVLVAAFAVTEGIWPAHVLAALVCKLLFGVVLYGLLLVPAKQVPYLKAMIGIKGRS